ncbi:MAG: DPP IV N-terminal domain-containing protein [Gaiellaceae bacterium]
MPKSLLLLALAALCLASGAGGADPGYELVYSDNADSAQLFVVDRDGGPPRQLTSGLVSRLQPAWSPDGRSIAYVRYVEGERRLFLIGADGSEDRPLTRGRGSEQAPSWSPDSRSIVFVRDGDLFVVDVQTGVERRLLRTRGDDGAPAWSPDGARIAFSGFDVGLSLINADGSGRRVLNARVQAAERISWSPDGRRLVAAVTRGAWSIPELVVVSAAGVLERRLARAGATQPSWSPDGARVVYSVSCNLCRPAWLASVEVRSGRRLRLTRARLAVNPHLHETGDRWPSWSPDGSKLVFARNTAGTAQLYAATPDGSARRRLASTDSTDSAPVPSPDGSQIAFLRTAEVNRSLLYVMNVDGSGIRPVAAAAGLVASAPPAWSPDGRSLAITTIVKDSLRQVWIVSLEGPGRRLLTRDWSSSVAWSPDGRTLAYTVPNYTGCSSGLSGTIWLIGADGSGKRRLRGPPCAGGLDWSPDGLRLAYHGNGAPRKINDPVSIWTIRGDGGQRRRIANPPRGDAVDPRWSPDGRLLAYALDVDAFLADPRESVYVVAAAGGVPRPVAIGRFPDWLPKAAS